jgi:hypothetical protein
MKISSSEAFKKQQSKHGIISQKRLLNRDSANIKVLSDFDIHGKVKNLDVRYGTKFVFT